MNSTYLVPVTAEDRTGSREQSYAAGRAVSRDVVDTHLAVPGPGSQVTGYRGPANRRDGVGGIGGKRQISRRRATCGG
jgi:hypothetical protein